MPQENVEIRLFYDAFNRRDFDDALQYVDPEVELRPAIRALDQEARYLGREGLMEFLRSATEPWESVTAEPTEMIDVQDDRVLVDERWLFRGRDGIAVDRELHTVFTLRNGLIVRADGYTDKAEALEAVGLRE